MPGDAARPLTERQKAVMERIDRRVPIKMIARDLDLSETRINQHIRALKNVYEVGSLGDLVDAYREQKSTFFDPEASEEISENEHQAFSCKGFGGQKRSERRTLPQRQDDSRLLHKTFARNVVHKV